MISTEDIDVLLVEDSKTDEELTLHAFRQNQLTNRIEVVRDGEQALDLLFCRGCYRDRDIQNPPRVILLDIKLPKVDGLEVLRQLKSDPRTKCIPVVMLTSSQEERDVLAGYTHGANSYIVKPVGFEQLTAAVRDLGMYWLLLNKSLAETA